MCTFSQEKIGNIDALILVRVSVGIGHCIIVKWALFYTCVKYRIERFPRKKLEILKSVSEKVIKFIPTYLYFFLLRKKKYNK